MKKPSQAEIINHLCDHFGLTLPQALEAIKTPMHPANMRDDFAALAMQGMLANSRVTGGFAELAEAAYQQADAMLAERTEAK